MSSSNIAPVKWAQRKDSLYITISLADVKDHTIDLTEKKITFSGVSGNQAYTLDLELVSAIVYVLRCVSFVSLKIMQYLVDSCP